MLGSRSADSPHRRRFCPQLEALEDRQLLTAAAVQSGNVLTITGSNRADVISIEDSGRTVKVTDGIIILGTYEDLSTIHVYTRDGSDSVGYTVATLGAGVERALDVRLGKGQDTFTFEALDFGGGAWEGLAAGSNLDIYVKGADGNDKAQLELGVVKSQSSFKCQFDGDDGRDTFKAFPTALDDATNVDLTFFGGRDVDSADVWMFGYMESTAALNIDLHGEEDRDLFSVAYSDRLNGQLNVRVDGGDGPDHLDVAIDMRDGSRLGRLTARVYGGNEDDNLKVHVTKQNPADAALVDAAAWGGPGLHDTCDCTPNVGGRCADPVVNFQPIPGGAAKPLGRGVLGGRLHL